MKVSRSGYYGWKNRGERPVDAKREREALLVRESFYYHRRRYGTRRLSKELKSKGSGGWPMQGQAADERAGLKGDLSKAVRAAND